MRVSFLSVGVLFLGACNLFTLEAPHEGEDAPPIASTPSEEVEVEIAAAPEESVAPPALVTSQSEMLFASAEFPPNLWQIASALDAELRADAEAEFAQMEADATRYKQEDPDYFQAYGLGLKWDLLGAAGDLVSLHGFHYFHTGGAHPNFLSTGLIYDRSAQEAVELLALFDGSEHAAALLVEMVREDIVRQKGERYAEAGIEGADIEAELEGKFSDSGLALNEVALAGSTEPDRFGGVMVYFSPYEIGPYAEGSYEVVIPQSAFRGLLKAEYLDLFAGEPLLERGEED